jgi:hypothetical protein
LCGEEVSPFIKIEQKMMNARTAFAAALLAAALPIGLTTMGCDRKETIMEVETPQGEVEVERNVDDGSITIDVDE